MFLSGILKVINWPVYALQSLYMKIWFDYSRRLYNNVYRYTTGIETFSFVDIYFMLSHPSLPREYFQDNDEQFIIW